MVKEQHKRYGSRGNDVSMRSSYFANFERSWLEVRTKLARTSYEVGLKFVRVGPKFLRSSYEVGLKLGRSSFEVGSKFIRS